MTAVILVSQPLSGCLSGSVVGVLSDGLKSRWGRRRPTIVTGTILTATSLLALGWGTTVLHWLICGYGVCDANEHRVQKLNQAGAVLCTIAMGIAVQPIQSGIRSLIVEQAPASEQDRLNAWAGRSAGLAAVLSLYAGSKPLPAALQLGPSTTQFQALVLINCSVLTTATSAICWYLDEPDNRLSVVPVTNSQNKVYAMAATLWEDVSKLSCRISHLCKIQFFNWFAWFSVLYGTTTYINELGDVSQKPSKDPSGHSLQAGSFASMCFALVGLFASFILPAVTSCLGRRISGRKILPRKHGEQEDTGFMMNLWTMSLVWIAIVLFMSPWMPSQKAAIVLIAFCGLSWAVSFKEFQPGYYADYVG